MEVSPGTSSPKQAEAQAVLHQSAPAGSGYEVTAAAGQLERGESATSLPPPLPQPQQLHNEQTIQELHQQIISLERKLDELHATDVNSLRRAYKSLAQHVLALELEAKHLPRLVDEADAPLVTPEFVAKQAAVAAAAAALVWCISRVLRMARAPASGPVSRGLALLGLAYVGVRWALGATSHARAVRAAARAARRELRSDVAALSSRLAVMGALAGSGLQAHGLSPWGQLALQQEHAGAGPHVQG